MGENLTKAIIDFLPHIEEYNVGELGFNLCIDLDFFGETVYRIQPHFNEDSFSISSLNRKLSNTNPNRNQTYKGAKLPPELSNTQVATDKVANGIIYLPCFRTLMVITEDFYHKWKNEEIEEKEWIDFIFKFQLQTLSMKYQTIHNISLGSRKGLSQKELEYIRDSYVPIFIMMDTNRMDASTDFELYISSSMEKAGGFLFRAIQSILGGHDEVFGNLITDPNVYYGGFQAFRRETTDGMTCYFPKIDMINRGLEQSLMIYSEIRKVLNNLTLEEITDWFHDEDTIMQVGNLLAVKGGED